MSKDDACQHEKADFNSSLLQATVSGSHYRRASSVNKLELEDYKRIGALSFAELAELRHRGAFSTVAQTFTACCISCVSSQDPDIAVLPKIWFNVRHCVTESL